MLNQIFKGLEKPLIWFSCLTTYTLYLVPWQLWKFQKKYPDTKIIVSGVTKARKMEASSPVQYELGWITSRRSLLVLTNTHLICSDWIISLDAISVAILLELTGGYVLKISTVSGEHYQFGLNKNFAWETQSILPFTK